MAEKVGDQVVQSSSDGPLGADYVIRGAGSPEDVERVAVLNGTIHGDEVAELTRALFLHHPNTRQPDLLFVEHVPTRQVVSSLCLIPWVWLAGGVEVPAAEMGIVGTLDRHRRRGLVRALVRRFRDRMVARGFLVSHIQGIPGFYDQFGYEYCLPLEGGIRLELRDVPDSTDGNGFTFRRALPEDLAALSAFYDEASGDLSIRASRDDAVWEYILTHGAATDSCTERWLVIGEPGRPVGAFAVPSHHFGEELVVTEASRLSAGAAHATLRQARALARERGRPGLRLNLPANHRLMDLARSLGGHDLGTYAWQVLVPSCERLLTALATVLEQRVAGSSFAGLTRTVGISLYRETIRLCFRSGLIERVESDVREGEASVRMPKSTFAQLVLGSHSLEALESRHPDVRATPADRMLIDVLFPPLAAFLYQPY